MNLIFTWIIAETAVRTTIEMLKRVCPKCHRQQIVPKDKVIKVVPCDRCGAPLPPGRQSRHIRK